jgi:hypothetical protein
MTSKELIEQSLTEANQTRVNVEKKFLHLSSEELNWKPDPKSWSAAECFQHLIFTNNSYLKHFSEVSKTESGNVMDSIDFKHSFWGKLILYFVNPKTKMKSKTSASFNPSNSKVDFDVIRKYLEQNDLLTKSISGMQNLDLKRLKIASPINSKIRYNLGDAIRILILHDQRHIQQAEKALGEYYEK